MSRDAHLSIRVIKHMYVVMFDEYIYIFMMYRRYTVIHVSCHSDIGGH